MRICLLNALTISDAGSSPTINELEQIEISAPLGILSLASTAIAEFTNIEIIIVNINELYIEYIKSKLAKDKISLTNFILDHIEAQAPAIDIIGFSSICSSYPLTLRLATQYKSRHNNVQIILGGPQASATDMPTMNAFSEIDAVFRGEAEHSFISFINSVQNNNPHELHEIKGLTFKKNGNIYRNADSEVIVDLDKLPIPAYNLDPHIEKYKTLSLEIGRGCPYNCTFCSTCNFFGRRFRLKSPETILQQMIHIKRNFGINNIGLDHDMFAADRKKVIALCNKLIESGEKFYWGCSARIDCLDNELISLMSKAGCNGIFFGIESASERIQNVINKRLNLTEAVDKIEHADKMGVKTAVSLITAFPDETENELNKTLNFFIDSLRFDNAQPQIGILAPLAGSPLYEKHKNELVLDHVFSEMSFQGWRFDDLDLKLIEKHPDVFPDFYSIPNPNIERKEFKKIRDFVTALQTWFRWLPVAMEQESSNMLNISRRWIVWRKEKDIPDIIDGEIPYYCHQQFADNFLDFVTNCYCTEMSKNKFIIQELVKTESFSQQDDKTSKVHKKSTHDFEGKKQNDTDQNEKTNNSKQHIFSLSSYPYQPQNVVLTKLNIDYKELLKCLREKNDFSSIKKRKVTVVFRETDRGGLKIQVRQLSSLSKQIINLCNGKRTINEILNTFSKKRSHINGVSSEKVGIFVLLQLAQQGLIALADQAQKDRTAA